jgi:hypothetical protein
MLTSCAQQISSCFLPDFLCDVRSPCHPEAGWLLHRLGSKLPAISVSYQRHLITVVLSNASAL